MVTVANDRADQMRDLPADPGRYGLPVRSLLTIASLRGTSVLAGKSGLDREVRRVNVMEVPDILPWVKPHELLLTTGFPLRAASTIGGMSANGAVDPDAFARLITDLDRRGLSAIAIKLGRYLDELPPEVLEVADQLGMPVLRLPDDVAFDDVITDVFTELVDRHTGALARADELHRVLAAIVLEGGDLPQITDEVARLLDAAVLICTPDGRVQAQSGAPGLRHALGELPLFDDSGRFRVEQLRLGVHASPGGDAGELLWCRSSPEAPITGASSRTVPAAPCPDRAFRRWNVRRRSPRWRSPRSSRWPPSRTSTAATTCARCSPVTQAMPTQWSNTAPRSAGTSTGRWWSSSPNSIPRTSTGRRRPLRSPCGRRRNASRRLGSRSSGRATRLHPSWVSAPRS